MNKKVILNCLVFVKSAVENEDKDMLRSYTEQLMDLVAVEVQE